MATYSTPGVYFEWLDPSPRTITPRRTDIGGFVGIAERGPLHLAVKVESWQQFQSVFGAHIASGWLAYAVQGFFLNGGRSCWCVRVADAAAAEPARVKIPLSGGGTLEVAAESPGVWGRELTVVVLATSADFSLIVKHPRFGQEFWRNLSLKRAASGRTVAEEQLAESRLVLVNVSLNTTDVVPVPGYYQLAGGKDGLSTLTSLHFNRTFDVAGETRRWGLAALSPVDEVSILSVPDIMPKPRITPQYRPPVFRCDLPTSEPVPPAEPPNPVEFPCDFSPEETSALQSAMIQQCEELKDRFAVLDSRATDTTAEDAIQWRLQFDTKYAAIYFPWIQVEDDLRLEGLVRSIPPSGHVTGIYARGDQSVGVHKPPANALVDGSVAVAAPIDDIRHGILNERGVNAIRPYASRGIRVMGARTVSSDAAWRYVNVRRLITMIEEAIDEDTQSVVFEPNNPDTWNAISRSVTTYLRDLWRRGFLDGAKEQDAFFVRCDETTNPPEETDEGRLTCLVGVQPPWPAEFVVLRIGRTEFGSDIKETAGVPHV